MNNLIKAMVEDSNYKLTENGALAVRSTLNPVLDLFAFGGAYRNRSELDCILLFKDAYECEPLLALKCLFYLGDCRGGQGERRFFRTCFRWLAKNYTEVAKANLINIPIYRRWDDLIYSCLDTPLDESMLDFIAYALHEDMLKYMDNKPISLLAKWLPSENASSKRTKKAAGIIRNYLDLTHKEYRSILSTLREYLKVTEKLMSENRWNEIDFSKLPSKAGFNYRTTFARREETKERYMEFISNKETKVNAKTLYPYEIVKEAITFSENYSDYNFDFCKNNSALEREAINKYWENLPDYFGGKDSNILCVVDTSASMWGDPICVAISLGLYSAERAKGPFANHYISFSRCPRLIETKGVDFVDKVKRIFKANLCENTNLTGVFDMLLNYVSPNMAKPEDLPETIVVISDMEIDSMTYNRCWCGDGALIEMERIRKIWEKHGLKLPKLVYWNVDARQNTILDRGPNVSYVSGLSPSIFETVITGKTGIELMLEKLLSARYSDITIAEC